LEQQLKGHNKEIENSIIRKYITLRQKKGGCTACQAKIPEDINEGRPVSFYVIGEDFPKQSFRVMFVGKTVANGWESETSIPGSDFIDARKYSREKQFLPARTSWVPGYAFWEAIKGICQILWKDDTLDEIWRKIAITNLVKCSTSVGEDTTPPELKKNCIETMRFFENEVIESKPTHLVIFSGGDSPKFYDQYISNLSFGYKEKPVDEKNKTYRYNYLSWWHRKFVEADAVKMHMLRTYHPASCRGGPKEQQIFCNSIAEWVIQNPVESWK